MEDVVRAIVERHLKSAPDKIERLKTGISNEVYRVTVKGDNFVVRMNKDSQEILGTKIFTPIFLALGIHVPKIIAENYDASELGYAYQIIEHFPGIDLKDVVEQLTDQQIVAIAKQIATIFLKLRDLPTNGSYGFVTNEKGAAFSNWNDWVNNEFDMAVARGLKTKILADQQELVSKIRKILDAQTQYFSEVRSIFYYPDIAGKNILVDNGKFTGLVDLDTISYGDPLESVGRIYASWPGTHYGNLYSTTVIQELELDEQQKAIVKVYALLHRFSWMCENGIIFNANTTGTVNREKQDRDLKRIDQLLSELY